jgi:uncharacterized UBP type Zn finger protein
MTPDTCVHVDRVQDVTPSGDGCVECLQSGSRWVHLRLCLTCGHVGCCDSSPNKHATRHHAATTHPIVRSFQPGESWGYCYEDDIWFEEL